MSSNKEHPHSRGLGYIGNKKEIDNEEIQKEKEA